MSSFFLAFSVSRQYIIYTNIDLGAKLQKKLNIRHNNSKKVMFLIENTYTMPFIRSFFCKFAVSTSPNVSL